MKNKMALGRSNHVLALVFALVFAAGFSHCAEVAYTAGATDKNNLADAANWGGTLPTADDIGVIDCSQFGHSFLARGDVAFGGLRFVNNSKVVYIEDDGASGRTLRCSRSRPSASQRERRSSSLADAVGRLCSTTKGRA